MDEVPKGKGPPGLSHVLTLVSTVMRRDLNKKNFSKTAAGLYGGV